MDNACWLSQVYVAVQSEGGEYLVVVNIAKDQLPKGVSPVLHW